MTMDVPNDPHASEHSSDGGGPKPKAPASSHKDRIIEALMELAAEREWADFGIGDVAQRAGLSLADFRDAFPSKGAALAAFARKIDRIVLDQASTGLAEEAPRERLFDILMRRLDALAPYRLGLQSVVEWVKADPLAATALNGVVLNSMRFMLVASGIELEGPSGAIKLQGLAWAWWRVLGVWFEDEDTGLARTMAALDKELSRGETWVARVDDFDRLVSPLRLIGRAMMDAGRRKRDRRASPNSHPAEGIDADPVV